MAKSNEVGVKHPDVKYIDARGEFVEATDASAAFTVNMNDANAQDFIEAVKKRAGVVDISVDGKKRTTRSNSRV